MEELANRGIHYISIHAPREGSDSQLLKKIKKI